MGALSGSQRSLAAGSIASRSVAESGVSRSTCCSMGVQKCQKPQNQARNQRCLKRQCQPAVGLIPPTVARRAQKKGAAAYCQRFSCIAATCHECHACMPEATAKHRMASGCRFWFSDVLCRTLRRGAVAAAWMIAACCSMAMAAAARVSSQHSGQWGWPRQ